MSKNMTDIDSDNNSYLISTSNLVTDISDGFLELTGYTKNEIVDKNISEIFTNLLRLHKDSFDKIGIRESIECYIFTKSLEVREVTISISHGQDPENKKYNVYEKQNSILDDKLLFIEQLFKDNKVGCSIYSAPELILIKSNEKYFEFMDAPYNVKENCIGKSLWESVPGYEGSNSEELFLNIIKTGMPGYYNEFQYDHYSRGITYWDGSVVPIYVDGKVKLLVQTACEVTERVLYREHIKEQSNIIRQQNEQFNAIFENVYDAILLIDKDGNYTRINKSANENFNNIFSKLSVVGDSLKKVKYYDNEGMIISPENLPARRVMRGEKISGYKMTVRTAAVFVHVELSGSSIYDNEGNFISFIICLRDITQEKIAQEKIKCQNKLLERQKKLLDLSNEAFFAWDLDGVIIYWNKGAEKKYGYTSEEAVGCVSDHLLRTVHPRDMKGIVSILKRDGAWNGEVEHTTKAGKKLILESKYQVILGELGQHTVIETSRDITQRKIIETELESQKDLLEAVIENMTDSLYIMDSKGEYIRVNKAGRQLFYSTKIKKIGDSYGVTKIYDLDGNEITYENATPNLVRRGEKVYNRQLMLKYYGDTNYVSVSGTPIFDESGKFIYGVLCYRNISELYQNQRLIKEQQEEMLRIEKEKNEALIKAIEMKDEFLSLISHEFKTPLTVINSAIQAIELICIKELSAKSKGYLKKIKQNSDRQLKLVNNLLDITRVNAGHLKINKKNIDIVLLTRLITESINIYAEQKNIKLSFSSTLSEKVVGIDEEKYERILLNLLSNAIKFTPAGKSITVKASEKIVKRKGMICIRVEDTGVGIPHDKKELIFKRFGQVDSSLTRRAEGTGLGLSLVKMFTESLGGNIELESKVGEGSTFTIMFPTQKAKETPHKFKIQEISDNRLIQASEIEFSDIYL